MQQPDYEVERRVYGEHREALLSQKLEGHYAVIKGEKLLSTEPTFAEAIVRGIKTTRSREFFVQRIEKPDAVEWLSHVENL